MPMPRGREVLSVTRGPLGDLVTESEPVAVAWFIHESVRGTATAKQEGACG
jgi:hypothetical protein